MNTGSDTPSPDPDNGSPNPDTSNVGTDVAINTDTAGPDPDAGSPDPDAGSPEVGQPPKFVQLTVSVIRAGDNEPVAGATLAAHTDGNDAGGTTGASGVYTLNFEVGATAVTAVSASAPGYTIGNAVATWDGVDAASVTLYVYPIQVNTTVDVTNGATVALQTSEGEGIGSLEIPAGALANAAGQIVTGEVTIEAAKIHVGPLPTDPAPAPMVTLEEGQEVGLISHGMMEVTVKQGDEVLDVAVGQELGLTLRADPGSPPTSPIWSYDEDTGQWVLEGETVREDQQWSFGIHHLSLFAAATTTTTCTPACASEAVKWNILSPSPTGQPSAAVPYTFYIQDWSQQVKFYRTEKKNVGAYQPLLGFGGSFTSELFPGLVFAWDDIFTYIDVHEPVADTVVFDFSVPATNKGANWQYILGVGGTAGDVHEGPTTITCTTSDAMGPLVGAQLTYLGKYDAFGTGVYPSFTAPGTLQGSTYTVAKPEGMVFLALPAQATRVSCAIAGNTAAGAIPDPHGYIVGMATLAAEKICKDGACTANVCGDSVKAGGEGCDDGNKAGGDGCSSGCTVEAGWKCIGLTESRCQTTCAPACAGGAVCLGGGSCEICSTPVTESFGAGLGHWTPNGDAVALDQAVQLTPLAMSKKGHLVNKVDRIDGGGVSMTFDFQLNSSGLPPADGIAFTVVDAAAGELDALLAGAALGGGLGYHNPGANKSAISVEVDTYDNGNEGIAAGLNVQHVAVTQNLNSVALVAGALWQPPTSDSLADGNWHTLQVDISPTSVRILLDDHQIVHTTSGVNFKGGYMFFSGSTGSYFESAKIDNVRVTHGCDPACTSNDGSACTIKGAAGNCGGTAAEPKCVLPCPTVCGAGSLCLAGACEICSAPVKEVFDTTLGHWTTKNSAALQGGAVLITTDQPNTKGQLVNKLDRLDGGGASISFDFTITATGSPADGIAFTIVDATAAELDNIVDTAGLGGGIGYLNAGLGKSAITVEIDTYNNGSVSEGTAAQQHIAVTQNLDSASPVSGAVWAATTSLADGKAHTVEVEVSKATIRVLLDGAQILKTSGGYDFKGGYMFFSGSTGSYSEKATIDNVRVTAGCDKPCASNDGSACTLKGKAGQCLGSTTAPVCEPFGCGDGILEGVEECDDKNKNAGDGCSDTCTIEPSYKCTSTVDINTGSNGVGGQGTLGESDLRWEAALSDETFADDTAAAMAPSQIPTGLVFQKAKVVQKCVGSWVDGDVAAQWINYEGWDPGSAHCVDPPSCTGLRRYYYRVRFNLPNAATAAATSLQGKLWADNQIVRIWLNGSQVTQFADPTGPKSSYTYSDVVDFAGWSNYYKAGENELVVAVSNLFSPACPNPAGLLLSVNLAQGSICTLQ